MIVCLLLNEAFSQTITIGNDTTTTSSVPSKVTQNFSYSQQIFTSTEIGQAGSICGISIYVKKGKLSNRTIKIYLGHTAQSDFSSNTSWVSSFALTEVYHGSVRLDSNSWNYINFNIPFQYNGLENLVIALDDNTQIKDSAATFQYTLQVNKVLYSNNNTDNPNPLTPPAGQLSSERNNVKIHFCNPTSMTTTPINNCNFLYADPGGINDYTGNLNITQTITSSSMSSNEFTISFMEFELKVGDTLRIYGGSTTNSPLICTLTSSSYPFSYTIPGSSVTFQFKTDGSDVGSGWLAYIACTKCNSVSILNGSPCQPNLQQNSGYFASPFCTDENPYGINFPSATSGNGNVFLTTPIGCLTFAPRPAWYFMQINNPGNMLIQISQTSNSGNGIDVDFACWGPFYALNQADFMDRLCCGEYQLYRATGSSHAPNNGDHSTNLGGYPILNLIDCSYSPFNSEWCYIPNAQANQFYILLITNYSGSEGTISFNTVAPTTASTNCSLLAQVSNNGPLCEGSTLQLICNNPQPNSTYSWTGPNGFSSNLPNPIIPNSNNSHSGSYTIIITSNNISSPPATTNVVIIDKPDLSITANDYSVCMGDTVILTASGATHYVWSNGLGIGDSHLISPLATTTYTVTGTSFGCSDTASCTILVNSNPNTNIVLTGQIYCPDDGFIPVSSTTTGGGGVYNYSWSGTNVYHVNANNTEITLNPSDCNEIFTVFLTATDQNGCSSKDSAYYHLTDTMSPWFMSLPFTYQYATGTYPNYYCPDLTTLLSNNILDNCWPTSALTYIQEPTPNTQITESETIYVTISDPCGNDTSTQIPILLPLYAYISEKTNCSCYGLQNGTATVAVSGGLAPYTYSWSTTPPQTTQTATSLGVGTYYVTVTDALTNTFVSTVEITQPAQLTSVISGSDALCNGDSTGTAQILVSGGTQPYQYEWSNGINTMNLNNLHSATYSITVTDTLNCTIQNTIFIDQPEPIQISSAITPILCSGENGTEPFQYFWNNGITTGSHLTNLKSGTYSISVTDYNLCLDTISVYIDSFIINSFIESLTPSYCERNDGKITIQTTGGSGNYQYNWFSITDYNQNNAFHLAPGNYNVTIQDENCLINIPFTINEILKPVACFEIIPKGEILVNQQITLYNCSEFSSFYEWNFGDMHTGNIENPTYYYNESGIFEILLVAINEYNCRDSIIQTIRVNDPPVIYIPNSFTPNQDGLNDHFLPVCSNIREDGYSFKIFNRWGEEVFHSQNILQGWNGEFKGAPVPSGTYTYVFLYENLFGQTFRKVGAIHLIR